ncbi:alpha/beta hydrolase [Microbacterium aurum]
MIRRTALALALALTLALALALTGCGAAGQPSIDVNTYTYSETGSTGLKGDLCLPTATEDAVPVVVLLHGGGFIEGSRASVRELCRQLAGIGIAGFAIDYRLLPDHTYPDQVDDALAAVAWLSDTDRAARLGTDPTRIGMVGEPAGAIITATIAAEGGGIAVAAALSPVADMTEAGLALGTASAEAEQTVLAYLDCPTIDECAVASEASPLSHVSPSSTPTFFAVGEDELVPTQQVEALHSAYLANGVPTDLVVVAGSKHGQQLLTSAVRSQLFTFLKEHL